MRRAIFAGLALGAALAAGAAQAQVVPTQAAICRDGVVDKGRLASWLLDNAKVSRQAEDWAAENPDGFEGLSPRARLIVDEAACDPAGRCAKSDKDALNQSRTTLAEILVLYDDAYRFEGSARTPAGYFGDQRARLVCLTTTAGGPVAVPGDTAATPFNYSFPLRVRGSTEFLDIERTDKRDWALVEGAKLTWSDDQIADKRVEKFAIVVSAPIRLRDDSEGEITLSPYVGMTRDLSRTGAAPASVTVDSQQLGLSLDLRLASRQPDGESWMLHWISLRPDFQFNDKDGSELWTVNAVWTPVINPDGDSFFLNAWRPIKGGRPEYLWWRPMFDLRAVAGDFTDRGMRTAADSEDFVRLGTQFGVALTNGDPRWPFDLLLTETWLPSLDGGEDLDQFKARLFWALDPERMFGTELTYVDGQRSDLTLRERGWKLSLTAKY